jgi:hypothetical protein
MASDPDRPPHSASALKSVERQAAEHEARGLLNLVALADRLRTEAATAEEASAWAQVNADARGRLERLYAAGLPRNFM